jgi:suppressor of G2 allele of SKP1
MEINYTTSGTGIDSSATFLPSWTETSVDGSAVDALALGDAAFVNERYDDALTNYTVAMLRQDASHNHPISGSNSNNSLNRFRIHAHRAAAHAALSHHEDCINDTEIALALLPILVPGAAGNNSMMLRSGEVELCWRRQGLAHFALQDMARAKLALEKAEQLACLNADTSTTNGSMGAGSSTTKSTTTFDYTAWIKRCNNRTDLEPAATDEKPSANLLLETRQQATASTSQQPEPLTSHRPNSIEKPRYQYYQNDKVMTIAILEPNVQDSDLSVECDKTSIRIYLVKQGKEFSVLGGALSEPITSHQISIRDEKVLVKLRKAKPGEWYELLDGKKTSTLPPRAAAAPTMMTDIGVAASSVPGPYASGKDWQSIEKEIKQQEEIETPKGDDAMNKLFQQIYANADEDTRRAMIKSYQTSGGTVLSTNWGEVAAKDYEKERTAPKGVEWKSWEGEKLPMEKDDDE